MDIWGWRMSIGVSVGLPTGGGTLLHGLALFSAPTSLPQPDSLDVARPSLDERVHAAQDLRARNTVGALVPGRPGGLRKRPSGARQRQRGGPRLRGDSAIAGRSRFSSAA
eukprot:761323-Rhodomonas_salina.1